MENTEMKTVIVVGGGFGGLAAARGLLKEKGLQVEFFDRKNHHLFQPLLYQVATAGLNPADIAVPIRAQFDAKSNVRVHLDKVESVDLKKNTIRSKSGGEFAFDYLILSCGATHSYFGKPEWEEFAPGLKTIEQATEIRRRILTAFELAENESNPEKRKELLTFVVVGGGPTGIEMVGAISDLCHRVLMRDFKNFSTKDSRIVLIEAGDKVLSSFSESLSQNALNSLKKMQIEVRLNSRVTDINADSVRIGDDEVILTKTVVWAAGVQASQIEISPAPEKDRSGRIFVDQYFALPGHENIFVIGDMAAFKVNENKFLPGLAPVAKQAGEFVALHVRRKLRNKPIKGFRYLDKGQMATIGKRRAVAQVGAVQFSGITAWFAWLFVHVMYLVGFKNKTSVIFEWIWSYLFEKRGSRLITGKEWKLDR